MLNKDEIIKIVNKTFYNLGYKKKYTREYYVDLVVSTFKGIDWDKTEKCNKPHIQNLPYDLRTSNIEELTERFNKINEELKKVGYCNKRT